MHRFVSRALQFANSRPKALICSLILLAALIGPHPANADGRWALVLAVADYADDRVADLNNTVNDGRTMASVLNQMGFEVYYAEDATREEFAALVDRVVAEQGDSDLGMFYFAGHGLQVDGGNYALPADINVSEANFLQQSGISVGNVISRLRDTNVENLVVILDACRNSPFDDTSATGTGLALVDAPENTIIAYSTAPGELADDGVGANSPYTAALATALEGGETDIRDALRLVRARVRLATGGQQTPWFIDNSRGEMRIAPRMVISNQEDLPSPNPNDISLAATAWWTIANSADARDFESYLASFPGAEQSEKARRQLALISDRPKFPLMDLGLVTNNPEVPGGLNSIITACDILATSSNGYMSLVEQVPHDLINIRVATRACTDAVHNDPDNPRLLGLLAWVLFLDDRHTEALYYNQLAADRGHAGAFGAIANAYRLGLGVEVDLERAAIETRRGALMGATRLRVAMGVYYREGWGVPQSFNEARRWFEIAALAGNVSAMSALGDLYRRGQLGEKDPARALEYYRMAAALEQSDAMNNIGMAYMRGDGIAKDTDTGIAWLSRASDFGNPYAAYHLGRAFRDGWGVSSDADQALAYFRLSAQRNFLTAYMSIGDVLLKLDQPRKAEALANFMIAREAGELKNTIRSREEAGEASAKIAELRASMTSEEISDGERIADEWISQYGLLDFTLVNQ